jgi:large subunit ribosomal protein L17
MKHGRKVPKLQRDASHRKALLANLACSLIEHRRIRTTLAKAKALRPYAEKLVTLGKRGDLHARRLAVASLRHKNVVKKLFEEIAVASKDRNGGYTRITKLGQRRSDSAPMAYIEWVDAFVLPAPAAEEAQPETAEATAS